MKCSLSLECESQPSSVTCQQSINAAALNHGMKYGCASVLGWLVHAYSFAGSTMPGAKLVVLK